MLDGHISGGGEVLGGGRGEVDMGGGVVGLRRRRGHRHLVLHFLLPFVLLFLLLLHLLVGGSGPAQDESSGGGGVSSRRSGGGRARRSDGDGEVRRRRSYADGRKKKKQANRFCVMAKVGNFFSQKQLKARGGLLLICTTPKAGFG
jgi:hypothetical protein